jgi:hypothetical protein
MIEDNALTSGLKPNLTFEKTTIGRVFAPGPVVKLATTKSSNDRVNARSQPEIIEGKITGAVIFQKILLGKVPRS